MHRSKHLFIALTLGLGLTVALLTLLALPARAIGFTVTKFTDTNDGVCNADCSLREAIITTNAITGVDNTITLGAGTYTLSIGGSGEDLAATGDLDISVSNVLTITGLGPSQTIIDAAGLTDSVFQILAGTVVISGVTIQNSELAINISSGASLKLVNTTLYNHKKTFGLGTGGAIYNAGDVTIEQSDIYSNSAWTGGGIYNTGNLTIDQSDIYSNTTGNGGDAITNADTGYVTVTQSSIYRNYSSGFSTNGAIRNNGNLTVIQSNIYSNSGSIENVENLSSASATLVQSHIYSNSSSLVNSASSMTISQSHIYNNNGWGIENQHGGSVSSVTVTHSSVYSNSYGNIHNDANMTVVQSRIYDTYDDGINNDYSGNMSITGSNIYQNDTGIVNRGDLTINQSRVNANRGTGIDNDINGTITVTLSSIDNNSDFFDSDGIYNSGNMTIDRSSIVGNGGYGILNSSSVNVSVINSTVSGNEYGGIYNNSLYNASLHLTNTTIAMNLGEGIWGSSVTATNRVTATNSIIADNSGSNCSGSITSLGHNLSSDDTCALSASGDITNTDPLLEPLANNGGPTVGVDNDPLLTHALPADSPAVDAANVAACPATDQLGNLRPYGPGCDIGAFEVVPKAVLYIRKSAPITVASGGQVDYVITVTNRGNLTATNVNITDTVPANTHYVSGGTPVGGDVTWSVGNLGPKADAVRSFAVTTTKAAININYIASADGDVTASRNEAIVTIVRQFGVGTSVFVPVQSLGNPPRNSRAVAVGDLNTDGYPDAFVANGSPNTVYLNNGNGRLNDSGQTLADNDSQAVALGDLDDDGDLDAFVGNDGSQNNQIWLNNGDGNFVTTGAPSLGSADSQAVALADLNGDGLLDVMLGTDAGDGNQIWLNNGEGSLALTETLTVGDSQALALVDFNDDGFPDAVSANAAGEDNQIWLNDGDGTFSAGPALSGLQDSQAVAIGDINDDGQPDVIIGNSGSAANHVWLNNGSGSFDAAPDFTLGNRDTRGLALGDLDLDGDLDLLVANGSDQPNEIWLNDGSGDFGTEPAILFDSSDSNAIALADFDLDGDLDIFVGNGSSGDGQGNTVWLNQDAQQDGVTDNSGGTLVFGGELTLTVNIPAGSLPVGGANFTYTPLLGPTPDFSNTLQYDNRAFELNADTDVTFDPPITLTVYYPPETEITTDTLRLYYRDTDQTPAVWKDVTTTCVPTSTYRYTAEFVEVAICHLTEFALFDLLSGGGSDVFLPLILKNE